MIASPAPLRYSLPLTSTPLIRVSAENGTKCASCDCSSRSRMPYSSWRGRRSSGPPASRRRARRAARLRPARLSSIPGIGMNWVASRLPRVIVPVLSSSRTSTSPEASTERPERARTLWRTRRSMPAIPIAESRAPIVVGISATSRAIRVTTEASVFENSANGRSVDDDHQEDQGEARRGGC